MLSLNSISMGYGNRCGELCVRNEKDRNIVTSLRHFKSPCTTNFGFNPLLLIVFNTSAGLMMCSKKYEFIFHFNFVKSTGRQAKWSMQISYEMGLEMKIIFFLPLSNLFIYSFSQRVTTRLSCERSRWINGS